MNKDTSWDPYSAWYDSIVGEKGHYFHREVIWPYLKTILTFSAKGQDGLIDLGCGQGFLAGQIPQTVRYVGIDIGKEMIIRAKNNHPRRQFYVRDLSTSLEIDLPLFTHAVFLLSLQNIADYKTAINNAAKILLPQGKCFFILNHPCFRIPRQSGWGVDSQKQLQYRRIDRYSTRLDIPITMHPGKDSRAMSVSFHRPLSDYFHAIQAAQLKVITVDELYSHKQSSGKKAKMENRARAEFPYFLAITAES